MNRHESYDYVDSEKKTVTMWHRSLPALLQFYSNKLDAAIFKDIKHVETCIGGDHGKATYLFVARFLFRYNDIRRETYRLEIKLGEINPAARCRRTAWEPFTTLCPVSDFCGLSR